MREKRSHLWDRHAENWYVDPPSCAHALFDVETFRSHICDPCCGMGNVVRAASARGYIARGRDLIERTDHWIGANCWGSVDFLSDEYPIHTQIDFVFNPPYGRGAAGAMRLEEQFIAKAQSLTDGKVAALLRLDWLAARRNFIEGRGLTRIWVLTPRPSMPPGELIAAGKKPGNGFHDYAWFIFEKGEDSRPVIGYATREKSHDLPENWMWRFSDQKRRAA